MKASNVPRAEALSQAFFELQERASMTTAGNALFGAVIARARDIDARVEGHVLESVTLTGREAGLFAGHHHPQHRLGQILSSYYMLVLRHLPAFTPDEWAALAAIFNQYQNEFDAEYLSRVPPEDQYGCVWLDPSPDDMAQLANIVTDSAEQRQVIDGVSADVDLFGLAARLAALNDVQRLAVFEKLMSLLHHERCDLGAHAAAIDADIAAAIAELISGP